MNAKPWNRVVVSTGVALVVLYVGAYALMVRPVRYHPIDRPKMYPKYTENKRSNRVLYYVFFGINLLDRKVRHVYWSSSRPLSAQEFQDFENGID